MEKPVLVLFEFGCDGYLDLMTREPRRRIEEVIFDRLGPLSARALLAMTRDGWESLRAKITDHRNGKDGLVARCLACDGEVYITTSHGRPLFAHYQGSDPHCPWYTGKPMRPDDVRAAQYQGQQESPAHRRICNLIAELAALDERCEVTKVDEYLPSTNGANGRYPDVLVHWRDFGRFVVEYQMSHTFQTEISERCIFYEAEGIPLLWVLSSFEADRVPQAVSDVVHRHRGNAFVLDQQSVAASREQKTLMLTCYLRNEAGFDDPRIVRFDELAFPDSRLPYLEDRLIGKLLEDARQRRHPYLAALRAWGDRWDNLAIAELDQFVDRHSIDYLVASAFEIFTAAEDRPEVFASRHANLKGTLNGYLSPGRLDPFAHILTKLIQNSSKRPILQGTVGVSLKRSVDGYNGRRVEQVSEDSPEWRLIRDLFPEALDPFKRQQLKDANALPPWADPGDS